MTTEKSAVSRAGAHGKRGLAAVAPAIDDLQDACAPSEAAAEGSVKPTQHAMIVFRLFKMKWWCCLCIALSIGVCAAFGPGWTWDTYDGNLTTHAQIVERLKYLQWRLSVPRFVLSTLAAYVMGLIAAVFCVDYELQTKQTVQDKATVFVVKKLLPYFLAFPLVGLVFQEQPAEISLAIANQDLGVYDVAAVGHPVVVVEKGSLTRANTTDTILRRALLPSHNLPQQCDVDVAIPQSGNEFTSVAYPFLAMPWLGRLIPNGTDPTETYVVPGSGRPSTVYSNKTSFAVADATLYESLFTRAVYLYVDSVLARDLDLGGAHASTLQQLKLDTIAYSRANRISESTVESPTDHLTTFVRSFFSMARAWSSLLLANDSDINVEYATFNFTKSIAFISVTLDIPIKSTMWHRELADVNGKLVEQNTTWSGSGPVQYEFDVANECGPKTCGIQNRGLSPDPQVIAYGVCLDNGSDCSKNIASDKVWLFGFGRRIEGDRLELLDSLANPKLRKAVLTSPREYHRVTMGLFILNVTNLSKVYNAECRAKSGCAGLDMPITTNEILTVGINNTPIGEFGTGFDLWNNHARGESLVTRYTTGRHVEFEILRRHNFDVYIWPDNGLQDTSCSGRMERSITSTELNHVYMEQPLQVTYTAGLFFLFHNARATTRTDETVDFIGNDRRIRLSLVVPPWQVLISVLLGGVFFLIVIVSLFTDPDSIELTSLSQLQDPDIFVRALIDYVAFPPLLVGLTTAPTQANEAPVNLRKLSLLSVVFEPPPGSTECVVIGAALPNDVTKNRVSADN